MIPDAPAVRFRSDNLGNAGRLVNLRVEGFEPPIFRGLESRLPYQFGHTLIVNHLQSGQSPFCKFCIFITWVQFLQRFARPWKSRLRVFASPSRRGGWFCGDAFGVSLTAGKLAVELISFLLLSVVFYKILILKYIKL